MTTVARATQTVSINSGSLVSGDINLVGAKEVAIVAPVVTSGQLYVQVGVNSGTYLGRIHDPRSQSHWFWDVGAGSASVVVDAPLHPFNHARIEMQNSQAGLVDFTIVKARG